LVLALNEAQISLWIFPEGTRYLSEEPDLLHFKKGAFYLAVQGMPLCYSLITLLIYLTAGVPVVPVICQDYYHLFNGKTRFRRGNLRIKGIHTPSLFASSIMTLAVLPPIPTTGLTAADVPALMEKTRGMMLQTLRELSSLPTAAPLHAVSSPTPLLSVTDDGPYHDHPRGSPSPDVNSTLAYGGPDSRVNSKADVNHLEGTAASSAEGVLGGDRALTVA